MSSGRVGESFDDRRIREAEEAIGDVVALTAVSIAVLGTARIGANGWWFALTMSMPLIAIGLRKIVLDRWLGIRAGAAFMVTATAVAAASSTILDGGMASPGFYWGGIVAMLGMALFPESRSMLALGGLITIAVTTADALMGQSINVYEFFGAFILAVATPATVERIVGLERLHRARSVIDPLTGCLNRRALDHRATEIEERSQQVPMTVAVINADIDHFKQVNDRHGHDAGDRVLAEVAYELRKGVDHFDSVFRAGGEEFVVVLSSGQTIDPVALAERLRVAIEGIEVDGIGVTSSFGVATGQSPVVMSEVFRLADHRLYEAKAAGRNLVVGPVRDRL